MGTVAMGCPTAGYIAVGGWAVGTVAMGVPTAFFIAVGGWAVGTVGVGSPTAIYVAVDGWAVGAVAVVSPTGANFDPPVPPCSDAEQSCRASNMLAPIRANQGKDGFCTSSGSGCSNSGVATYSSSV